MGKVILIPVDVGVLGAVPNRFQKFAEGTEIDKKVEQFQKTVLMGTAATLRLVLERHVTRRKKLWSFLILDYCLT